MIDHIIFFRKGLIVWPTYLIHVACHFTHKFLRDFTSQAEDLLLPRKKLELSFIQFSQQFILSVTDFVTGTL